MKTYIDQSLIRQLRPFTVNTAYYQWSTQVVTGAVCTVVAAGISIFVKLLLSDTGSHGGIFYGIVLGMIAAAGLLLYAGLYQTLTFPRRFIYDGVTLTSCSTLKECRVTLNRLVCYEDIVVSGGDNPIFGYRLIDETGARVTTSEDLVLPQDSMPINILLNMVVSARRK